MDKKETLIEMINSIHDVDIIGYILALVKGVYLESWNEQDPELSSAEQE